MESFKIKQVTEILDINKSRVQYYYDTGVIIPFKDSKGPGTNRYFSLRNLAEIMLAMTLTKLGIGIRVNAIIIQSLREFEDDYNKLLRKEGVLKKNEKVSAIEPGSMYEEDTIAYLSISFNSLEDPFPEIDIINSVTIEEDAEEPINSLIINPRDVPGSTNILLVNLSKIKAVVENKLNI